MKKTFALVVDEPVPGRYLWSVIEPRGASELAVVVDFAMGPLPTELAAISAGHAALQRIQAEGCAPTSSWSGNFADTLPGQLD